MSYFNNRRKPSSEHVYADTVIWQCSNCKCWSRIEFVHVDEPSCPMCKGTMHQEAKFIRVE
ncbi:cold-inducible protein YdjO-related protein [Alicyclobacillus dauci]|uniref:Cold-shock protein n=1 Tax=Alicyclobacillus dauci TaxID=1475485 RepID=A0ABY6Z3V1_9BACL|nr:cold-inducible protein YdjO-related protein [Alicyclobacillus dauci]WAH37517.1 cold-shock protein [Alicyclobacillus dauci]